MSDTESEFSEPKAPTEDEPAEEIQESEGTTEDEATEAPAEEQPEA